MNINKLPPTWREKERTSSHIREKVETERWVFIYKWCKDKGVSPMNSDNYNLAAMEWAKENSSESEKDS